jgi:hypothetical protein
MPAHPARAILRATLRAARAWEAAASLPGDGVVRAREPVSRTACANEDLNNNGILDANYQLTLADGTLYNMGRDGGPRAEFGGRRPYEVDLSNPLMKYAISWINPLIDLITQGNKKLRTDFVGYFANAAVSNAKNLDDVRQNVSAIMQRFGVDDQKLAQGIIAGVKAGTIDPAVAPAYLNGIAERRGEVRIEQANEG